MSTEWTYYGGGDKRWVDFGERGTFLIPKAYSGQIMNPSPPKGQKTILENASVLSWSAIDPRIYDTRTPKQIRNWRWPYYAGKTLIHQYNVFSGKNVIRTEHIVAYNMALLDFDPMIYRHLSESRTYKYNELRVDYTSIIDGELSPVNGNAFVSFGSEDNLNTGFKFFSEFWMSDFTTKIPKGIFQQTKWNRVMYILTRRIDPSEQVNPKLKVSKDKHYVISYSMSADNQDPRILTRHVFV